MQPGKGSELACSRALTCSRAGTCYHDLHQGGQELQLNGRAHKRHPAGALQPGRVQYLQHAAVLWIASKHAKILSNAVALSEEPCMRHYYDIMLRQYHAEQPPALQRKTAAYSRFGSKHQLWPEVNQACAASKCCRMAQKAECLLSAAA